MIEDEEAMKSWLIAALDPICDAEPAVLADYIIALLKKDQSEAELRSYCSDNLEDFLGEQTMPFVEQLFEAVRSKGYLTNVRPEESAPAEEAADGTSDTAEVPSRTKRRSYDSDEESDEDLRDYKRRRRPEREAQSNEGTQGNHQMGRGPGMGSSHGFGEDAWGEGGNGGQHHMRGTPHSGKGMHGKGMMGGSRGMGGEWGGPMQMGFNGGKGLGGHQGGSKGMGGMHGPSDGKGMGPPMRMMPGVCMPGAMGGVSGGRGMPMQMGGMGLPGAGNDFAVRGGPFLAGNGMRMPFSSQMMGGGGKGMGGKGMGAMHGLPMGAEGHGPGCLSGLPGGACPALGGGMGRMGGGMGGDVIGAGMGPPGAMRGALGIGMPTVLGPNGAMGALTPQQFQLERAAQMMRAAQLRLQQQELARLQQERGGDADGAAGGAPEESERSEIRNAIRRLEQARDSDPAAGNAVPSPGGSRSAPSDAAGKGRGIEGSTVHVGNIPPELNDLGTLNSHFKQFGRIVNIQIKAEHRFAFIQFSSRAEAVAALDHPDPVLGDPHIKLNWAHHNFESARGGRGKGVAEGKGGRLPIRTPSSEMGYVSGRGSGRGKGAADHAAAGRGSSGRATGRGAGSSKLTAAQLQAQREQLIKAQLEEQKSLIAKLSSMKNLSKEERSEMMAQLTKLSESVQASLKAHPAAKAKVATSAAVAGDKDAAATEAAATEAITDAMVEISAATSEVSADTSVMDTANSGDRAGAELGGIDDVSAETNGSEGLAAQGSLEESMDVSRADADLAQGNKAELTLAGEEGVGDEGSVQMTSKDAPVPEDAELLDYQNDGPV